MKTDVGLWIDHKKAMVLAISGGDAELGQILSRVESQPRRSPKSRRAGSYEPQLVPADDSRQRASTGHLNAYCDEVVAAVRGADSILIIGPGEAKDELRKRLGRANLGRRVVAVEAADKMTDRQFAARMRGRFAARAL